MEILSKVIKIPSKATNIDLGFERWVDAANKSISIFYKKDDEHLLKDKWEVITLLLEREFGGILPSHFTEMVLFVEKKRKISNIYLFFSNEDIEKGEYLKHSFESFKNNAYPDVKETFSIDNVIRIRFKGNFFGNNRFWSVSKSTGETKDAKANWRNRIARKNIEDLKVLPVKFNNKNSNGLIDLGDILYKMFPANAYEFSIKSIASLVRYVFSNFVTGEHYSLKEKENMSKEEKHFFDNINIKEILLKNNNNIILMEDGSNYLMSLE